MDRVMNKTRARDSGDALRCTALELYGTVFPWSNRTHTHHAPQLRTLIKTVLMAEQRCKNLRDADASNSDAPQLPSLPTEMWCVIFSWVSLAQMLAF